MLTSKLYMVHMGIRYILVRFFSFSTILPPKDNNMERQSVEKQMHVCYKIYSMFSNLVDCYVLDYFTDDHWEILKSNWQSFFKHIEFEDLVNFLNNKIQNRVPPLTLLALAEIVSKCSLPREMSIHFNYVRPEIADEQFDGNKLFWKNVKAKKRHEISIMSNMCYQSARKTNCFYIVDVGSGVGHLSRLLNYGRNLIVCSIEEQESLINQARIFEEELEKRLNNRRSSNPKGDNRIVHVHKKIETDIKCIDFLHLIKDSLSITDDDADDDFEFGIVGLHPCGDLGATLLRLYVECENIKYINLAGCCYMKLTADGFPLSNVGIMNRYNLSYMSREIACHAMENYIEKLLNSASRSELKIHTYRALLEKLIADNKPKYRHCALGNVKFHHNLEFGDYCRKATRKIDELKEIDERIDNDTLLLLEQWKNVVTFYSIRLFFAPVIETIILLDRLLYVLNYSADGDDCRIIPAFDPKISPRNHVLCCCKLKTAI